MAGRVRSALRQAARRTERQEGQEQEGPRRAADRGHPRSSRRDNNLRSPGDGLVRQHRGLPDRSAGARSRSRRSSTGSRRTIGDSVEHDLRVRGDPRRHSVRERRAEPERRHARAASSWPRRRRSPLAGKDLKTGQTLIKTIIAPGLKARLLGVEGWYSTNILGNRDGEVLDDPESFKTKEESKKSVLDYILQPHLYPELYERPVPRRPDQLLSAARRQQGRLGQHRSRRLARLPDAAEDQLPVPRQHPGGADRARRRRCSSTWRSAPGMPASRSGCRSTSRARCTRRRSTRSTICSFS